MKILPNTPLVGALISSASEAKFYQRFHHRSQWSRYQKRRVACGKQIARIIAEATNPTTP